MNYSPKFLLVLLFFFNAYVNAQIYDEFYDGIVTNVSSSNILDDLTIFENFGTKEVGTTALINTKDWIINRYQSLGYTNIVEQPFSLSGTTTNNIIITKTGTVYPDKYLIIDAHYDTISGPGTNDNGSGTVILLELARLLKNIDTEYSIKFIHFSGEELGLIGSNYYVDNTVIPENLDIILVFNIDEVGGVNGLVNDTIICEKDTDNSPSFNNADSEAATNSLATCIGLYSNLSTEISYAYASDYIPFENNGEIITGLYEKNESPYPHSSNDLLVNMDPDYVYEVAKGALGATLYFAVGLQTTSSITDIHFMNTINLYPNPSKGVFHINFKTSINKKLDLRVVTILGEEVYRATITNNIKLDLSLLNEGIYFCLFGSGKTNITKKIIIN